MSQKACAYFDKFIKQNQNTCIYTNAKNWKQGRKKTRIIKKKEKRKEFTKERTKEKTNKPTKTIIEQAKLNFDVKKLWYSMIIISHFRLHKTSFLNGQIKSNAKKKISYESLKKKYKKNNKRTNTHTKQQKQ
jgi:hypothetical protein